MAAVVLLAAVTVVLVSERSRLGHQIDQLKAEGLSEQQRTRELENELEAQRDQSDKLAGEIARLREEQGSTERPSELLQHNARSVLSLVLSPMLLRGESEVQQLKLTKETAAVLLQMKVQQPDARAYRVDLRTVDGGNVWSTSSVKVRSSAKDRSTVSVSVPARRLDTNEYILILSATNYANQSEEISRYFFRVSKE
jgi:predicted ribosome quality control (RQC) complex YloA/Tae2 family protein